MRSAATTAITPIGRLIITRPIRLGPAASANPLDVGERRMELTAEIGRRDRTVFEAVAVYRPLT
jgi:hypothetical protein